MKINICKKGILPLLAGLILYSSCTTEQPNETLPFWHGQERQLRYKPEGEYFVGKNGDKRFTRAIYGTNTGFRFETSDYPEIGLYMPRLGGSIYMALQTADTTVWMKDLSSIESRFRSGERRYIIQDKQYLQKGTIMIDMLALSNADGMIASIQGDNLPEGVKLIAIYGGASNKRFSREGDLGADPKDCFYIKPENCKGNSFQIEGCRITNFYGKGKQIMSQDEAYENKEALKDLKVTKEITQDAEQVQGIFSEEVRFRLADGGAIDNLAELLESEATEQPVAIATLPIGKGCKYMEWVNPRTIKGKIDLATDFKLAQNFREKIAGRMKINTPDPYINTLGGIFAGAEDAVWEAPSYLHGAIGWRMPLTGWRAAYLGDLIGMHDRARMHFDGYAAAQITNIPVSLPHLQDDELHGARSLKKWGTPMYSNGYICRNPNRTDAMHHYDMNLVYIDELLWHLNWTGDLNYARKIFPVIKRHLQWEKQTFDPDNDHLYDAYCCIWASDALQYNGGEVTHSSAYNYRANKMAAEIAEKLGEDPTPYKKEAEEILKAINKTLWIPEKGWWAEFKDNMGNQMLHENAAVWTVYHSIDSDIHDAFKAYQATRYVDNYIPHIPVVANGLKDTNNYVISTTNWQPYMWSINNVAFGEIVHTAYSFWQAGRAEEAFKMFKGAILDAMYLGSGPGNITQISHYDAARGEMYRDFADPVAVGVRAVVQGMFGILPDLMNKRLVIRPGFPQEWNHASLETLNMKYDFKREGYKDFYKFTPTLQTEGNLILEVEVRGNEVDYIKINGKQTGYQILEPSIGIPRIAIEAGVKENYDIEIAWKGKRDKSSQEIQTEVASGNHLDIRLENAVKLYDPQHILTKATLSENKLQGTANGVEGHRTLFVKCRKNDLSWWIPVHIHILQPLEIINNPDSDSLKFMLVNHTGKAIKGNMQINNMTNVENVNIPAGGRQTFTYQTPIASMGTNRITISTPDKTYTLKAINWNLQNPAPTLYDTVSMDAYFNDEVNNIFAYGKYKSPRWPYTTLCVPTQGMGQWCHPNDLSSIEDTGLRSKVKNGIFLMPQGIPFRTSAIEGKKNIAFTTLWDNYPDSLSIALHGKASKAYLLVAASTYHMQSHCLNGTITVRYKDGTEDVLELIPPENLLPLDQDIFIDNAAFYSNDPRPYRIRLKTGEIDTYHAGKLKKQMSNNPIYIEGGMATLLDLPLDSDKELDRLYLKTIANEVIIGLMSVTLMRD